MNDVPEPLISIVDDDESVRQALKSLIDSVGFRAEVFGSGEEFLKSPYVSQTDCLITDVRMPGMSGLELQERLGAAGCSIPIVFISAHEDKEARIRGLRAGAVDVLRVAMRQVDDPDVRSVLERIAERYELAAGDS